MEHMDYKTLLDYVGNLFAHEHFVEEPHELFAPIDYTLALGGKRLRPVMLLAACQMLGGDVAKASKAAIGIEVFHNFTLLHDDLMDRSPLRRGMPTVYRKWNENTAILSGDTMFALAWRYFLQSPADNATAALQCFNETAIEVCRGQQYDMNYETLADVSPEQYFSMIYSKTSALFVGALEVGAIYAGAAQADIDALRLFGRHLGFAFQLQDDLLDAYGDTTVFGKKNGQDIRDNKKTMLLISAMQLAQPAQRDELRSLFASTPTGPEEDAKVRRVIDIYNALGVKQNVEALIEKHYAQATAALKATSATPQAQHPLQEMMRQLLKRDK